MAGWLEEDAMPERSVGTGLGTNPGTNLGKWLCVALIATTSGLAVASCGGSAGESTFDAGKGGDSSGGVTDATSGNDGPTFVTGDGGDATTGCTPKSCAALGYNCGAAVSCGTIIDCGGDAGNNFGCPKGQTCGGGGPNVCGSGSPTDGGLGGDGNPNCTPKTCAQQGYGCGFAVDGCGNIINCNPGDGSTGCTAPAYCGGGGYNVCGTGTDAGVHCTPTTCAKLGYNCGAADDGCGKVLQCGTCTAPQYCGGGGYDLCGPTNLAICDGGAAATSLTGFVYDPANHLPVYNALVYVPVGAVQTPETGVAAATLRMHRAARRMPRPTPASTAPSPMTGVPTGSAVTIVVQLGKWQRAFTQSVSACTANTVSNGASGSHLTLPSTQRAGQHPALRDRHRRRRRDGVRAPARWASPEPSSPIRIAGRRPHGHAAHPHVPGDDRLRRRDHRHDTPPEAS